MYKEITKEDFDRVFDEALLRQEAKERRYVIWTSPEMIDAIEKAIEKEIHNGLWWGKKSYNNK